MTASIGAGRVAALVAGFPRTPAYAGLADALAMVIGDGRIPLETRLPSERELTGPLGVSRTTVTRAYAALRDAGYAVSRRGSGTFTQVPGGRSRAHDRALMPRADSERTVDLNCAAPSAPPGVAQAYAEAVTELPAYLGGHGYFPAGLPRLQQAIASTYAGRGLPTDPEQIMVTPGALSAASIVAHALVGPGDRVLVESPVYPNAADALRRAGARLCPAPVDPGGWDLDATFALMRQTAPRLAYLIPDFQNPTGHLMSDRQREQYAAALRRTHTVPVVDEAHQMLPLDGQPMPRPFAAHAHDAITIGSASKGFWGGLRIGWIRAPHALMERLTHTRVTMDLGAPVLEQLVLVRLLAESEHILDTNRARLREQRDALVADVAERLPDWRFRTPSGGLALWCRLPGPLATAVTTEAEQHGVIVAPGPVFAVEGGLDRFLRIPWTRPADELATAVGVLARAWTAVRSRPGRGAGTSPRVLVA
jgi:DNA-binding transcriptional MocR family regulator